MATAIPVKANIPATIEMRKNKIAHNIIMLSPKEGFGLKKASFKSWPFKVV